LSAIGFSVQNPVNIGFWAANTGGESCDVGGVDRSSEDKKGEDVWLERGAEMGEVKVTFVSKELNEVSREVLSCVNRLRPSKYKPAAILERTSRNGSPGFSFKLLFLAS